MTYELKNKAPPSIHSDPPTLVERWACVRVCVRVCVLGIERRPVVPVEEEPVDALQLIIPEAVAVPVLPRLLPLLPQVGRRSLLPDTVDQSRY